MGSPYGHRVESAKYVLWIAQYPGLDFYLKRDQYYHARWFFRYFTQYIEQLPIRTIDFTDPADVARHDRMVALVTQMLDLHSGWPPRGPPTRRPRSSGRSR